LDHQDDTDKTRSSFVSSYLSIDEGLDSTTSLDRHENFFFSKLRDILVVCAQNWTIENILPKQFPAIGEKIKPPISSLEIVSPVPTMLSDLNRLIINYAREIFFYRGGYPNSSSSSFSSKLIVECLTLKNEDSIFSILLKN
jgi:hypothetical protein